MKVPSIAQISEALHGFDLNNVRINRKPAEVAKDIEKVLKLVKVWDGAGCSFIFFNGVLTASNGDFTANIDLGKGCKRGACKSMHYNWAKSSGLTYAERVEDWVGGRRDHYDTVLLQYLKDYM